MRGLPTIGVAWRKAIGGPDRYVQFFLQFLFMYPNTKYRVPSASAPSPRMPAKPAGHSVRQRLGAAVLVRRPGGDRTRRHDTEPYRPSILFLPLVHAHGPCGPRLFRHRCGVDDVFGGSTLKHSGQPTMTSLPGFCARRFVISSLNWSSVKETRAPRSMNMLATERLPEPANYAESGTFLFERRVVHVPMCCRMLPLGRAAPIRR